MRKPYLAAQPIEERTLKLPSDSQRSKPAECCYNHVGLSALDSIYLKEKRPLFCSVRHGGSKDTIRGHNQGLGCYI